MTLACATQSAKIASVTLACATQSAKIAPMTFEQTWE